MGKAITIVPMLLLALTVPPSEACLGFPMFGGWGGPSEIAEGAHQAIDVISAVMSMGSMASGMKQAEKNLDPLAAIKSQTDVLGGAFSKAFAGAGAITKGAAATDPAASAKAAEATAATAVKTAPAAATKTGDAAKPGVDLMSKAGEGLKTLTGGFGFGR